MASPLDGRKGLVTESPESNALAQDLALLVVKHRLTGAVLVTFTLERVAVNSSGIGQFGHHMEQLGDKILAAIDDGSYDPELNHFKAL